MYVPLRLKKPPSIVEMAANGQLVFTDVDKVTFKGVGGASNAVIDTTTGKIGVGVDSPDANLHVVGNCFVSTNLELGGTMTMGTVTVNARHELSAITATGNTTPHTVEFQNAETGLVTTGNVSVGKDLTVTGNVAVDTDTLFVDSVNNRVGVGTSNPGALLHIGDYTTGSAGEILRLSGSSTADRHFKFLNEDDPDQGGVGSNAVWVHDINSSFGQYAFRTNNTELLRIKNNGNVGIGTTSPDVKFQVEGTSSSHQKLTKFATYNIFHHRDDGGYEHLITYAGSDGQAYYDNRDNFMYVQIPAFSGETLYTSTVSGYSSGYFNAKFRDLNGNKPNLSDNTTYKVHVYSSRIDAFGTMTTTGNVGIGTDNPIAALDIDGGPENDIVPALSIRGGYYSESDLYVLNTYNASSGVGYAGKVIGVNIKNKVETDNTIQIRSNTGGLLSAGAMYLGSDNYTQGVFGVLTGTGVPGTALTERFRIDDVGKITSYHKAGFVVGNPNSGDGDDYSASTLDADWNAWVNIFNDAWIGGGNGWGTFWAGSSGALYRKDAADTNPNEYVFVGNGNKRFTFELNNGTAYFDGTLSQSNYDYAEYFEWEDGNPDNEDRRGYSVVLRTDGKIMKATSDDEPTNIIGIVSGTSSIVGDAAGYDWHGKYEVDEWGTKVTDEVYQLTWTEDGENHSYDEDRVPEGITVPENGVSRRLHNRERITPGYDETKVYIPRDKRKEWCTVGLLGKVRIRDGCPTNPNWRYMKTIAGKKLWLIR